MVTTDVRELWATIEWLNCQLEAAHDRGYVPAIVDRECIVLIKEGKYIGAIKHHREVTGVDLRTAKNHCDRLRSEVICGKHGEFNRDMYPHLR